MHLWKTKNPAQVMIPSIMTRIESLAGKTSRGFPIHNTLEELLRLLASPSIQIFVVPVMLLRLTLECILFLVRNLRGKRQILIQCTIYYTNNIILISPAWALRNLLRKLQRQILHGAITGRYCQTFLIKFITRVFNSRELMIVQPIIA